MSLIIQPANLDAADFHALIGAHKALMLETSPPESSHALLIDGLKDPSLTVWEMRHDDKLVGCGALKAMEGGRAGEIKSMHTVAQFRGSGLGQSMLGHIMSAARERYYSDLYLETGAQPAFAPARRLYERHGFAKCGPFAGYIEDPNSVFMHKALTTD
ncbi:GNAT family N-acetyltransferase [Henriciella litoralis]|uniref:GNAT family N-acetyltransferase n=1 Tax=Henriciella litoralis TaxID=568102 RepID=UPI000A057254|nr:GNAT family N-acetyltransferase [Henriciella litoralis]